MKRTRYEDHSVEYLQHLVLQAGPTVEAMGDYVLESIRSHIQRGTEPSSPGEGPTSHPTEFELWESWRRGRVRRRGNFIRCTVYSTARSKDGKVSLALVQEHGNDDSEPRPHIGPGIALARRQITALAQAALR